MKHNSIVKATSDPVVGPVESDLICILLLNGSLVGPFKSREDAMYWAIAQDLDGFSTYDLRKP